MTSKDLPALNSAVNRLMVRLALKQDELRRRQQSCGTSHDVRKMTALRGDIASLERRLLRAERAQEAALASPE